VRLSNEMKRRVVVVVGIVLVAVTAAGLSQPALRIGSSDQKFEKCGHERWKVKTLQDKPDLLPVETATIAELASKPKPKPLPGTRTPFEFHVFTVTARVAQIIDEPDGDLHLVLRDGPDQMIAEAPRASCTRGATDELRTRMKQARAAVKVCTRANITGVAFFDFFHNQTGVADNEIELHPILGFRCLTA
jgi:hypothetical protein